MIPQPCGLYGEMAPIRRYLRITKYSVLECRIYLDNPALANSWLLNARDPVLPRVIESIRPLVLPKLREEKERARKKGAAKKKAVKDVVIDGILWPPRPPVSLFPSLSQSGLFESSTDLTRRVSPQDR